MDPRYHAPAPAPATPARHSLSAAYHEKQGRKVEGGGGGGGGGGYTMAEVSVQRSVKSLVSRGIN